MLKLFQSDRFVPPLPEGHRFPIGKYQLVKEQLLYEGSIGSHQLEESAAVSEADVLRVHTPAYWQALRDQQLTPRQMRRIGFPQSAALLERSRRSSQGTVKAALHAVEHGIGMNLAGGTHHAYADRGEGFCLLNDMAIAIRRLQAEGLAHRILIVDLDVHQGNANAVLFAQDPHVYTFSIHGQDNYPLRKEQSDQDLPLSSGMDDNAYLPLLQATLSRLIDSFRPDFVFFQAGVDVLATDKLGKLALTKPGCKQRDEVVLGLCARHEIPVAVSMGGGYSARLADTVDAHANTFRVAANIWG